MHELELMTWNVRYFGHATRGLRSTPGNLRRAAEAIGALPTPPDVVALQEVETRSLRAGLHPSGQLQRFAEQLDRAVPSRSYEARYFPAHRYQLPGGPDLYTTGLALMVADTVEVLADNSEAPHEVTCYRLPAFARFKQRRIVAHAHLRHRASGVAVDLFNTHLSLPAFLEVGPLINEGMGRGSNQCEEVRCLLDCIDQLASTGRVILVGDFNTAPHTPAWTALQERGLVDAFAQHIDHDSELLQRWSTARFGPRRMHIDHVFASPELQWRDFAHHTACRGGPFHNVSDHVPKVGSLVLA